MPSDREIEQSFVDDLLALPTREEQTEFLRAAGLLNADGLEWLLDAADWLTRSNLDKADRLAALCMDAAGRADAPAAAPRAAYIRVHTHSEYGEAEAALRMAKSAHDGYAGLGMNLKALRTNVGKMAVLLESADYEGALEAGRFVLDALGGRGGLDVSPTPQEADLLTALVHQNRGVCLDYMGLYEEALNAYAAAEERYRALGMTERLGEVLDNQGVILSYLGRGNEALASHEAAAAIFEEAGLTLSHAMSLSNVGQTYLWLADNTNALSAFESARRLLDSFDAPVEEYFRLRNTADAYLALNLYPEALKSYREVDALLKSVGMEHNRAQTLWGMGSALIAGSDWEGAEGALIEAEKLFAAANNVPMLTGVMLEQAALLENRGDHEAALVKAYRALDLVSEARWPVQRAYAHLRLADLLLSDVAEAEPHLLEARRLAGPLDLPQLRYRLDERLGRLRLLQGREEEAQALLEAAVDEIERLRGTVVHETMRTSFLQDKTAAYEDLLRLYLARDDGDARPAFVVAERAKSRALVDLLTGVVAKGGAATADPELEGRLRDAQADLNATYTRMLGGTDAHHGVSFRDLRDRAGGLEAEMGRPRLQAVASSDPFVDPAAAPENVLERLPSDVVLLAYHVVGDEILASIVANGGVRTARQLSTVPSVGKLSRKLAAQWDRFRAGTAFTERHAALLERATRQVLAALYGELVAPLETLLETAVESPGVNGGTPRLVVVPHGLLHQVPFHALFDGERYVLERFEVSYAPSATLYALCQERAARGSGRALAFGVEDASIPAAAAEALAVARSIPGAGVRVGEAATVAALRDEAPGCDILHLACHGLFRAGNPMFSALKLNDGWLAAADALGLDLDGALVTLSACESGRGEVIGGDEVLGLTRAFLGAGAATLVVSLWLAQDRTTAALMKGWYGRMEDGTGRATALRAAQLEVRERYPHPYYWAPFVLIGKG